MNYRDTSTAESSQIQCSVSEKKHYMFMVNGVMDKIKTWQSTQTRQVMLPICTHKMKILPSSRENYFIYYQVICNCLGCKDMMWNNSSGWAFRVFILFWNSRNSLRPDEVIGYSDTFQAESTKHFSKFGFSDTFQVESTKHFSKFGCFDTFQAESTKHFSKFGCLDTFQAESTKHFSKFGCSDTFQAESTKNISKTV
jgi:hypothetical protein